MSSWLAMLQDAAEMFVFLAVELSLLFIVISAGVSLIRQKVPDHKIQQMICLLYTSNGWQRFSQVYGAPCATTRSTFSRQSFSALVTAGTTCSGRILENGGNSKGVSNGFVIRAVLVKEVKEALNRRFT